MGRLAIFVDGGYIDIVARRGFGVQLHYGKFSAAIAKVVDDRTVEPVELLRTFFYNCLPYQSQKPTDDEAQRYSQARSFYDALRRLPRYEVRLGRLVYRGTDSKGASIFQQKGVDLLLGLDFALLAGKHQIAHAAIVSGDGDLVPAVAVAKQEGVCVWLFHGPGPKPGERSSYARELWDVADERFEIEKPFLEASAR